MPDIHVLCFLFSEAGANRYQRFIQAVLIMSVLWKTIEFYQGESDRKVIVIAGVGPGEGAASLPQQAGFPIIGAIPSHQMFSHSNESLSCPILT